MDCIFIRTVDWCECAGNQMGTHITGGDLMNGIRKDCSNCRFMYNETTDFPCRNCEKTKVGEEIKTTPLMWEAIKVDSNAVNHPGHYNQGKYECLDVMIDVFGKDAVKTFCQLNAFKYIWRAKQKNGMEDMLKAKFYLTKYEELSDNGGQTLQ